MFPLIKTATRNVDNIFQTNHSIRSINTLMHQATLEGGVGYEKPPSLTDAPLLAFPNSCVAREVAS
jgi:hypothetical protein